MGLEKERRAFRVKGNLTCGKTISAAGTVDQHSYALRVPVSTGTAKLTAAQLGTDSGKVMLGYQLGTVYLGFVVNGTPFYLQAVNGGSATLGIAT